MFKEMLDNVRARKPLVHSITNYVTANDVANIILACGASPIMTDDPNDAEQITSICDGTNINIGTLNERSIPSMIKAGKMANKLGHPVLLDPVGSGAGVFRTKTARELFGDINFTAVRGNISEIKSLLYDDTKTRGVDANDSDSVPGDTPDSAVAFAKTLSKKLNSIVAITGAVDLVADADKCYVIRNGTPQMSRITGTGCQLSGMTVAYLAANPDTPLTAVAAAVCAMGVAGEIALENLAEGEGNATYRNRIIDAIYNLTGKTLEERANAEIR